MSNPLDPEMISPAERLGEAAYLLARGILRRRLRAADGRKKPLDVPRQPRDACVTTIRTGETDT